MAKKAAIVYFSGTGNTRYVAERMQQVMLEKQIQTDLINIEKEEIKAELYDYIVVGGPVYVDRYPEILLNYMERHLSHYNGLCMLYSTQGATNLTAAFTHAIKRLKTLNVSYCDFLAMPNNFYTFMLKRCTKDEENTLIQAVSDKCRKMVSDFLEGKTNDYRVSNFKVHIAESVYRMVYPNFRRFMMRGLKIDRELCVECGICERSCPVKSLTFSPELKINNDCTFCQRCIHNCPVNAFKYKGKAIIQYNPQISNLD